MAVDIFNSKEYIETFLKIKTKDNEIESFKLNEPQQKLYNIIKHEAEQNKPIRIIILKARQMGFSTLTEAVIFHRTVNKKNVSSLIIAHKDDATANLFKMSKLYYDKLPSLLKPMRQASNAYELVFANPTRNPAEKENNPGLLSTIKCATAGGSGVGRSDTYTNVHASEIAFWGDNTKETLNGLLQAVPSKPGTLVIYESTANGFNYFKEVWDKAVNKENDFIPVFFAWFELDEYQMPYDGFELTQEEKELQQRFNLSLEQLSWRRWSINNNCGGDIELFKQEYPATPDDAFIATGACIFDKQIITNRKFELRNTTPLKQGEFEFKNDKIHISDICFIEKEKGFVKIYEDVKKDYPYVIGCDTAGEGSDYFTAHVINNITGKQVAVFWGKLGDDEFAKQMYCLGMYYNYALIGIESNFTTHPIRELERLEYTKQYVREKADDYMHGLNKSFGYRTTKLTRPLMIGDLVKIVREDIQLINDVKTLQEMLSFIKNDKGRPEAEVGQHDDLVMGLAIAYQLYFSSQQTHELPSKKRKKAKWEKDMYEDYYRASTEQKELLIKKWGNPF
jgi:hypothetical protein